MPWWISCHNMSSDKFAYHAAPPASFYAYHLFAASSFGCRWVMPVNWQRPTSTKRRRSVRTHRWWSPAGGSGAGSGLPSCAAALTAFSLWCRTPTEGWLVGRAGIRQCALPRLTFAAGHGIRCGCGTRRKVSAEKPQGGCSAHARAQGVGGTKSTSARQTRHALTASRVVHHQHRVSHVTTSLSWFSFLPP